MNHDWIDIPIKRKEEGSVYPGELLWHKKCSQCAQESSARYSEFSTVTFASYPDCSGVYPIKVRIL